MDEKTNLQYLKGVGEKRAKLFRRLGVESVGDLVQLYPRSYEDWSRPLSIAQAEIGTVCCIRGIVGSPVKESLIRQGMTLFKTSVTDGTHTLAVTMFNNKYLAQSLRQGEEYLFFGKVTGDFLRKEMTSPQVASLAAGQRLRPVYPQTQGLQSYLIEKLVQTALREVESGIGDCLPEGLRERYCLMCRRDVLREIHAPQSGDHLSQAKRRLVFEELLILQLGLFQIKGQSKALSGMQLTEDRSGELLAKLPFAPTGAQRRAVREAMADLRSGRLMNRLLQGDVGSGKTAVAATLLFCVAKAGWQCAFMVPTEVLARQHYTTLSKLLQGCGIRTELLTGSMAAAQKRVCKQRLQAGEIDILIGTHALLQGDVLFRNLALVITDEQHRFGVNQRAALAEKGKRAHLYVMSATPIPRTLALIIYGDLDVSVLDELPPGRQAIASYAVDSGKRKRVYAYVRKHLNRGLQAYIVCPAVEEGETDIAAAVQYAESLARDAFCDYRVGLLHGKLKPAEKQAVMAAFQAGETQLLVATTVIEVGVDVPNAVIMVVENAERFGLSQLHQLRGRVGRGTVQSSCIFISDVQNAQAGERLRVLCETTDGVQIADADLKLRGPGDFFGARQHGLPQLRVADMLSDTQVIRETQALAQQIIEQDPLLSAPENRALAGEVAALFARVGETGLN